MASLERCCVRMSEIHIYYLESHIAKFRRVHLQSNALEHV